MNLKIKKKHITTLLTAMAALGGSSFAFAAPVGNSNVSTSFSSTVTQLNGLNVGSLPADIQTVVDNLNGYLTFEQNKNADLSSVRDLAQNDVSYQEQLIAIQSKYIQDLISIDPLNPQIAVEQGNLSALQGDLVTKNTTLTNAQSAVTNSDIKISLYQQAINGPVTDAQTAASDAASVFTNARNQFASGGALTSTDASATGSSGLQGVIDSINGVTAGDQAPVVAAIQGADTTFQGIGANNASIADIQALVGAINTNLPTLPPISVADKDAALQSVLNGSYERNAIDTIQSNGIAGIAYRDPATGAIHIGQNSLITNEVGGVQQLYAQDAGSNPININVTNGSDLLVNGVSVATDADVAAEATTRATEDTAIRGEFAAADNVVRSEFAAADNVVRAEFAAADVILQNNIDAEAATRLAEDTKLQANIDAEVANRIADVDAEETRARAAEVVLAGRATALETRASSLEGRATSLEGRASALEGRMGNAERDIRSLRKGIAMAAALQTPAINDGDKQAVKVGASTYDGEQGLGLGYAVRVGDSVTVNVDVATGFPETVARGGVNLSF
ncbi:MAG: hypothetical protein RLZZ50_1439 [Verrucomicrobiota bacterium]